MCGLFRPVILLPRSLAERLPPAQLRAVLLHELLHLRRGDVWVNCAQALLQIAYWWHPLLWLANARIRRVREEAVDDAVMLALNEDAEAYAPTLLEVAKLALHRPLASLGLVGILESRNALRQRIERLVDFRPPRKAGLTLGSALAVLAFAAVAVPMGQARAPGEATQSAASLLTTNNLPPNGLSAAGMPAERQPLYMRTFKINGIHWSRACTCVWAPSSPTSRKKPFMPYSTTLRRRVWTWTPSAIPASHSSTAITRACS